MVQIYPPKVRSKNGYFHLWIAAAKDQVFFASSIDKAFFISLLQDHLSPRSGLSPRAIGYSHEIDLIVYSLTDFGINLLVCTSNRKAIEAFGQSLLHDYTDYLQKQQAWEILPFDSIFAYDHLADEHEALNISREIHLLHDDWRQDRYSSIGFYLDDRRGDWMQPWRLTNLFHNDAEWYSNFLQDDEQPVTVESFEFIQT